jgi:hypothetical protein
MREAARDGCLTGKLQAKLTNVHDLFGAQVFLLDLVIEIILPYLPEPDLGRFYSLSVKQLDHLCTDDSIAVFSYHLTWFHVWLLALIIGEIEHKLKPTNQESIEFLTDYKCGWRGLQQRLRNILRRVRKWRRHVTGASSLFFY